MASQTTIPNGWKDTTLGATVHIIGGGTPKTSNADYWNGNVPWLSVVDFNNDNRWVFKTEKTITEKGLENSATKLLNAGDLIISARGTVGAFAQLKYPMAFNQSCYGLRAKEISDNDFLFYLLKLNNQQFKRNVHGAVFDTITRDTFDQIKICLPPLPEQKAIAAVLSSFDDKIELIREQNKTLETTAQVIFKEWILNFRAPGIRLRKATAEEKGITGKDHFPEGWRIGKLTEIADFLNGLALQKFPPENPKDFLPVIKIREMKSGITELTDKASANLEERYIVNSGDILFSWSGSLEIEIWQHGKGALNQHLFKVTSKKYPKWFYYYWIKHHLPEFRQIASAKAVTMGHIKRHHLEEAVVFIPNDRFLDQSYDPMTPIFDKYICNNIGIQTLSKTRDILLPKLMTGKIRVKKEESKDHDD